MPAYDTCIVKKRPGEFFLISTWSLLDVAGIGLCRYPLTPSLPHLIRFFFSHVFVYVSSFSSSTIQLFSSLISSFSSGERLVIFFLASSRLRLRLSLRPSG